MISLVVVTLSDNMESSGKGKGAWRFSTSTDMSTAISVVGSNSTGALSSLPVGPAMVFYRNKAKRDIVESCYGQQLRKPENDPEKARVQDSQMSHITLEGWLLYKQFSRMVSPFVNTHTI